MTTFETSYSHVHQLPDKSTHALNTRITALVNQYKFFNDETREMLMIMVLQHAVVYHEAQDWIQLCPSQPLSDASSTRRPWRRARQTSPPSPQWPPQHPPFTRMPSQSFQSVSTVATPTAQASAWLTARIATTAVAGTTTLPCIDINEDPHWPSHYSRTRSPRCWGRSPRGQFIAVVNHASQPRLNPMQFHVFQDAMRLHILLSYATMECLGILKFKVNNLSAQLHICHIVCMGLPFLPS